MDIDTSKVAQECIDAFQKQVKELKKLNIVVVGKSGVGKSTLINSLFRDNFAKTGLGRPVTSEIRKIEKKDYPLVIYDTPGFELSHDQQAKIKQGIIKLVNDGIASQDINQAIHCIWYCINVGANRTFDESEIAWIRDFSSSNNISRVPIVVVLTQACPKKKALEMKALVEAENLDVVKVIPVLAQDMDFDGEYTAKAYGLDTLVEIMGEVLPEELQKTFQNIQKASLDAKKKYAHGIVAATVAASFGEGFAPLKVPDAVVLIPTQVTMIAGISVVFGMDLSKTFLTAFATSTIGTASATLVGKRIVTTILSLIPKIGKTASGLISGAVAGLLTTALGEAFIQIMSMVFTGEMTQSQLENDEGQELMNTMFREELHKRHVPFT